MDNTRGKIADALATFSLCRFMNQSRESLMKNMPDRISDEVISNDPQDAPEAVFQQYLVTVPVKGHVTVTCNEENKLEAIAYAIDNRSEWDISDLETDINCAEVEEVE